jgi:Tfp pilus assembly protein PilF
LWWLLVVLMILLNFTLWQRPLIGSWLGSLAMRAAGEDDVEGATRYLDWSRAAWRQSPEAAMAEARLARRANNLDKFALQLKQAQYLGAPAERIDREWWLASAQSGQLSAVKDKLGILMETAGEDGPQVCEAFALGYMRMRDFTSALALLNAWAADYPNDARPHAWIGSIHSELQANEPAEKAYREALRIDAANARAAQGLGTLLLNLKRPSDAIPYFEQSLLDPNVGPESSVGLASALQSLSNTAEATAVLKSALERFPNSHSILGAAADALIKEGDYAEAEKLLEPDIRAGSKRRELRYFYAIALRGLGKVEDAKPHFDYAAEANEKIANANRLIVEVSQRPQDTELRFRIGEAHLRYGNSEDGLMWLNSVLELAPGHTATHAALAEYYQSQSSANPSFISLAQRHRQLSGIQGPTPAAGP